jgi:ferredoxin
MAGIIFKKDIKELLSEAGDEFDVYFPVKNAYGDCQFMSLDREKDIFSKLTIDYENRAFPPKDIFFPQLEKMFIFKKEHIEEKPISFRKKLIFSIKACDLRGLQFSDEFFKRNFKDKYYLLRIKDRLTIVVGCLKPPRENSCFCTSSHTGPFLEENFDLQFIDLGEAFFVEVASKKAKGFVKKYRKFFKRAQRSELLASKKIKKKAYKEVKLTVDFFKAIKLLAKGDVPLENYKRIAERCIYCGGCLYICPTCTCFNVFDYKDARFRCWDACIFEGYTREAGGANPRKEKWQRTARRYEHKLVHDYNTTGMSGCVGCGRCLEVCPVNIGISKFIQEVTENKKSM